MITRGDSATAQSIRARLEEIRVRANNLRLGVLDRSMGPEIVESGVYEVHTTTFDHSGSQYLGSGADLEAGLWCIVNSSGTAGGGQRAQLDLSRAFDLSTEPVAIRVEWMINVIRVENTGSYPDPFDYNMGVVFKLQAFSGTWRDVPGGRYFVQAMHDPSFAARRAINGHKVCSGVFYITEDADPGSISKVRILMSIFAVDTTGHIGAAMVARLGGVSMSADVMKIGVGV